MNLALIGPTGAGKGTQGLALVRNLNLDHLSTGDLFRENLANHTALGLLARKYMDRGELVPDEVVEAMIEERVRNAPADRGILFDGFPRTEYQARFLDDLFTQVNRRLDGVLLLNLGEAELLRRLRGRLVCRQCHRPYHTSSHPPAKSGVCDVCGGELIRRHDDDAAQVQARVSAFQRAVRPVLEYYQSSGRLRVVEVEGPAETVQPMVLAAIRQLTARKETAPGHDTDLILPDWHRAIGPARAATRPAGLDVALLGGPGSGKGTQAETLSREFKVPHIASGDLFRENLRQATDLGRQARVYMDRGELVPDEITEAMVRERLSRPDTQAGFVLDGFPRTLPQADSLQDMLADLGRQLAGVLYLKVSDDEIVNRLSGRLICRQCQAPYHLQFKAPKQTGVCDHCGGQLYQRDDDNPATVRARLKTFHAQTVPLIEYYQRAGLLVEVDGENRVEAVTAHTLAAARRMQAD